MKYILPVILFFVSTASKAATWFVDCSAVSDGSNAGTSFAVPFERLTDLVWATIESGDDDILFKEGTTCTGALNVQASGTSGTIIEIGVYDSSTGVQVTDGSKRATIDGNNANVKPCEITSRSWIRVIGIDCKGSSTTTDEGNIHIRQSDDITWYYSTASAGTGTGRNGFLVNRGNRVDVRYVTANDFTQHGMFLYMPAAGTYTSLSVRDSNFNSNDLYGIRVACDVSNITVPSLTISNNISTGNGAGTNGWGFRSNCPLPTATITGNNFSGNFQDGIELGTLSGLVADYDYTGAVVSGNTLNQNCQFGLHGISARNYSILSNTALYNGCNDATDFSTGIELVDNSGARETGANAGTLGATTGTGISFTTTAGPFDAGDIGEVILANNTTNPGAALVTAVTDANTATVTIIRPFTTTTVGAGWLLVRSPYNVLVRGNTTGYSYNYISDASEGIGIRLDDNTLLSTVSRNFVIGNEGRGIAYNGPFNTIESNILVKNGVNPRALTTATFFEIGGGGVGNSVYNNSINIGGAGYTQDKHGISDNSATNTSTDIENNAIWGDGTAAIERVDTVSTVAYNAIRGNWTRKVQDTSANSEVQTAGEVTANFKWLGGSSPLTAEGFKLDAASPLCGTGTYTSTKYDYYNIRSGASNTIGAISTCYRNVTTTRSTYVPR